MSNLNFHQMFEIQRQNDFKSIKKLAWVVFISFLLCVCFQFLPIILDFAYDLKLLKFNSNTNIYLEDTIPAHLRDKDGEWFAITKRARIIAYNKNANTDISKMKNYEDLAKPEFKGQIVMRSATAPYSKTLLASIIANDGDENAKVWAKGVLDNLATKPKGGDRDQARQVFAGEAKFAVMNTYYIGLLKNSKNPKDVEVGNSLGIIFPNQDNRGTHINISGIAMTKSSKNQEAAKKFMEFMLTPEIQKILTDSNYEFPIRNDVELSQTVKDFGTFKEDQIPVSQIAEKVKEAVKIYDQVGFR